MLPFQVRADAHKTVEYRSIEDDLNDLRSVTADSIRATLDEYPLARTATATVGPLESLNGS